MFLRCYLVKWLKNKCANFQKDRLNGFYVTLNTDFKNENFKYADLGSRDNFWVKPLAHLSKSASLLRTLLIDVLAYKRSLRSAEWLCLNDKFFLTIASCRKYGSDVQILKIRYLLYFFSNKLQILRENSWSNEELNAIIIGKRRKIRNHPS